MFPIIALLLMLGGGGHCDRLVDTTSAPQKGAPVRAVKNYVTENDYGAEVDLLNTTNKDVLEVQLGWTIESPANCGTFEPEVVLDRPESVTIKPGAIYRSTLHRIGHQDIGRKMLTGGIHRLNIQIGVVHVVFADGQEWNFALKDIGSFDDHAHTKATACKPDEAKAQPKADPNILQAGDPLFKAKLLLADYGSCPACRPDYMTVSSWTCGPTASYTYCTKVTNGANCTVDSLGYCCFTTNCAGPIGCGYDKCVLNCHCVPDPAPAP